jgi:glucosamine 6-phosphate synthetase-like amidotransferase/phosphosugar isomerase protein
LLAALERLEYRGYDSAGLALVDRGAAAVGGARRDRPHALGDARSGLQ